MINYIKSAKKFADFPETSQEIVIVGKSNVGKSSFINALYNQKLAYVGKTAGKTRLLNFFNVNNRYTMVDVPGYGYANRSGQELIEFGDMMDGYFTNRQELKLVIMLVDIRHDPTKDDLTMIEYLRHFHKKVLIVANKADKLSYSQSLRQKQVIAKSLGVDLKSIIACSSLKKTNFEEVKAYIEDLLD